MVLRDYANGSYRKVPWKAVAALAAAVVYVVSPFDLIPDFLVPLGFTDDVLALALTWGLVKRELREYCAWKGLSPAHFGLLSLTRRASSARARAPRRGAASAGAARHGRPCPGSTHSKRSSASRSIERACSSQSHQQTAREASSAPSASPHR